MLSVSDILKILDNIPVWKTLGTLPKRVEELERRLAAIEAAPKKPADPECPLCHAPMKVTKVEPHRVFGPMGVQNHTYACTACNHKEERKIDPR